MIYRAEDASSRALRTRDFEPRLINNVESLVDHNNVQSWVDPNINQEGLDFIFGTRDAEQRLGPLDPSNNGHYAPASGPSTIPPTIKVFMERIQNGSFVTHARGNVDRFNKLMKKYNPTSYWIKQNLYAQYVDNAEKLQNYLEHVHKVIKEQLAQKQKAEADAEAKLARELARVKAEADAKEELARAVLARAGISEADLINALSSDFTTIHDVYNVEDELKLTPTTSTVTITTAILTTPHIGRRIRKKFFGKWHSGIITSSDEDDLYHVKYDDGDSEDLDHDEMHKCLLYHEENESISS
jgi:hypothetical protein